MGLTISTTLGTNSLPSLPPALLFPFSRSRTRLGRDREALASPTGGSGRLQAVERGQPAGQPSSISAQLSRSETLCWAFPRATPDPKLFLESSQGSCLGLPRSQPCQGQPYTNLRKGGMRWLWERCGCRGLGHRTPARPTHMPSSTSSIVWALVCT